MDFKRFLVAEACIFTNYDAQPNKVVALTSMCRIVADHYSFSDSLSNQVVSAILAREQLSSTAIGQGLALPHAKIPDISQGYVGWFTLKTPIDFDSLDGAPVNLIFFQIASIGDEDAMWMKATAAVSRMFRGKDRMDSLVKASSSDEFRWLLNRYL